VDGTGGVLHKGFATPADLICDFLNRASPYDPKDYVRCAVEVSNGAWLPMHFYGEKAGLDRQGLADFIQTTKAPKNRRHTYADRALGKNSRIKRRVEPHLNFWTKSIAGKSRNQRHRKQPPMSHVRLQDWQTSRNSPRPSSCQCPLVAGKSLKHRSTVGLGLSGRQLHGWMSCIVQTTETNSPHGNRTGC